LRYGITFEQKDRKRALLERLEENNVPLDRVERREVAPDLKKIENLGLPQIAIDYPPLESGSESGFNSNPESNPESSPGPESGSGSGSGSESGSGEGSEPRITRNAGHTLWGLFRTVEPSSSWQGTMVFPSLTVASRISNDSFYFNTQRHIHAHLLSRGLFAPRLPRRKSWISWIGLHQW
jgi:hypothetical protein